MLLKLSTWTAALLVSATILPAFAQETLPRRQQSNDAASAEREGRVTRARDLLGLEVVNQAGESYGMIEDLLIDKKSGQVEFALVAENKEAEELYPLPWKTVTLFQGEEEQYVILNMEKEQFSKAPKIIRQDWPTMTYTQWNTYVPRVQEFYRPVRPAEARAVRRTARAIRRAVD